MEDRICGILLTPQILLVKQQKGDERQNRKLRSQYLLLYPLLHRTRPVTQSTNSSYHSATAYTKLFNIMSGGKGRYYWPGCYTQHFPQDRNFSLILIVSSIWSDLLKSLRRDEKSYKQSSLTVSLMKRYAFQKLIIMEKTRPRGSFVSSQNETLYSGNAVTLSISKSFMHSL